MFKTKFSGVIMSQVGFYRNNHEQSCEIHIQSEPIFETLGIKKVNKCYKRNERLNIKIICISGL